MIELTLTIEDAGGGQVHVGSKGRDVGGCTHDEAATAEFLKERIREAMHSPELGVVLKERQRPSMIIDPTAEVRNPHGKS